VKTKRRFLLLVLLPVFVIAMAALFAFSSCCISIPLKFASSAVSAASSASSASGDESTVETLAQASESDSSTSGTDSEITLETNEPKVLYSNDFTLYDMDKNLVSMHDYAGKIVVLNFWATWCPPCVAEIPDFVDAWNTYKSKNIQFFGISDDDVNAIAAFVKENKMTYPTLLDGSSDRIMQSWGIDAIPHTFILDGSGEIVFDQLGMMSGDQLINSIEDALNKQ
jgi:peroxiredoxin